MTTFNIYRRESNDSNPPIAIATGLTSMSYSDATAEVGKQYLYSVGAIKSGFEKVSSEVLVSTVNHPVLSLFKNAEKGLWLDFSDMSSLYQDSAETVSVTAVSQPIGKVLDKSGNSNHAAQTASSRRPVFQTDGAFFDGVDDFLTTVGQVDYGGSNNVEVFLKIKSLYGGPIKTVYFVIESGSTYTEKAGSFATLSREESKSITAAYSVSTSPSQNIALAHTGDGKTYNGVYSLSVTDTEFILNVMNGASSYSKTKPSGIPVPNNLLMIGARHETSTMNFYGYIKQIVIVNRELTALERSDLTAFLESH